MAYSTNRSNMPTPIESLANILRQERAKNFQDSAVFGGLDRFLERWADELRQTLGDIGLYSRLTPHERQTWADGVMTRIQGSAPRSTNGDSKAQQSKPAKKQTSPARRPPARKSTANLSLDDEVSKLPIVYKSRVAKSRVAKLKRLDIETVKDLIYHFPHRHNDYSKIRKVSQLVPDTEQTSILTVWEASETSLGPRRKSTQAILGDDTGNVRAIWFNQPWIARNLSPGTQVVLSGRVKVFRGQFVFESPEYEYLRDQAELVHTGRLVPVYPLTDGLYQRTLRRIIKEALDACVSKVEEFLPDDIKHRTGMMSVQNAITQMHYPESESDWNAARKRLAFDELFLMQLAVINRRQEWQEEGRGIRHEVNSTWLTSFLDSLPFALTGAQARTLDEILTDMKGDRPMGRLLQGDVGSGKTIIATTAMLVAVLNGNQSALMAPTEILAEQHFLSIRRMLSEFSEPDEDGFTASFQLEYMPKPIVVGLLLGSLTKRVKDSLHQRISDGELDIIIGTQALIQEAVDIPNLSLVVTDEQHRFGVMQRATLREKGRRPHVLAMSATPIPRSLALTLYGDLDISIIDEMPPGRQQIKTRLVDPKQRDSAYQFIKEQVEKGRQAFIVFPLIEASEAIQARAATDEYERLSTQVFPELRLGLLHGRMALREKEEVMGQFKDGELDVLLATAVVEVGIDVPNATVMLIDGADRFGLAQLHQFRGRVGRGVHQSYCLLLADFPGEEARERLKIVERTLDGFQLAEEDLRIRGPGDYLGTRQSGLPNLRVARITDQDILGMARREATKILEADPELSRAEHAGLARRFDSYSADISDELS